MPISSKVKTNLNSDDQVKASNLGATANADRNETTLIN